MTKKQITFFADEATVAELDYLTRLSTATRSELIRTLISKEYKLDLDRKSTRLNSSHIL